MSLEDWWGLVVHDSGILLNPLHYLKILYPLKSLVSPISYQDLGIGGYTRLERDKLSEDLALKDVDAPLKSIPQIHAYNVFYLRKIYHYCQEHHLELIFFNMPSYPTQAIIEGNMYLHRFVEENYPNVPFYDYELMQLPDSAYLIAEDNGIQILVSRKNGGARVVSERMADDLTNSSSLM